MTSEELAGEIRKALVSNKGDGRDSYLSEDVAAWLLEHYRLSPAFVSQPAEYSQRCDAIFKGQRCVRMVHRDRGDHGWERPTPYDFDFDGTRWRWGGNPWRYEDERDGGLTTGARAPGIQPEEGEPREAGGGGVGGAGLGRPQDARRPA
jgi:hypothetical protein